MPQGIATRFYTLISQYLAIFDLRLLGLIKVYNWLRSSLKKTLKSSFNNNFLVQKRELIKVSLVLGCLLTMLVLLLKTLYDKALAVYEPLSSIYLNN
ncbi:hypothetical protein MiSe_82370 [Microseira wollei NIES-4236]|uniref:Uncharacterized protein n=1 Tax=Microseira wollei NIES-4236 TaxID=2530354 RepID=A0AAV3XLQ7_9CYAN|nr:hypothetical protein MiSe_82370 [Microseira wollei NIES-4236]